LARSTPRALDVGAQPGTWPMETAAAQALQALVLGKTIEVRFAGERNDRYGRLKGHAFIRTDDSAGWVQGLLLGMGLARAYTLAAHRACAAELLAAERSAREARLGLWAEAAYKARQADPSAALLRHVGTFQLVEVASCVSRRPAAASISISARSVGVVSASRSSSAIAHNSVSSRTIQRASSKP
jgi:hypothetical protein